MSYLPPGHAPLKPHPFANLFPMLSEAELGELAADIAANGQVETVKLHRGMILDGRNRYAACAARSLGVRTEIFEGDDRAALAWVISKNLKRRHLNESQRAMVAARIATLRLGDNQQARAQICAGPDLLASVAPPAEPPAAVSQSEAAASLNVSRRSVQTAANVLEKAAPEVAAAVDSGAIAVSVATEIVELPKAEQAAILAELPRDEQGKLTPEAKKKVRAIAKEVRSEDQAAKREKRKAKEAELGAQISALPEVKAGVILSDFEWHFKVYSAETGMDRHAANHYLTAAECETAEAIVARQNERMQVAADDCVHFMWVPACFDKVGHRVMELQGFKYVTQFVWVKPGMGTGYWVRDAHELLLIGVRGKVPAPSLGTQFRSVIDAPRAEHSEKPDAQYEIIEAYFPTLPKIELNARRARPGWIQWGNEAPVAEAVGSSPPCGEGAGVGVDTGGDDEEQAA
ncbi:MT-A70 family methyltransferase [Bradyrhizobium sp. SRS-191]|uniref:Spo0J and IME4 domain-containing protein n=1 Tax=Bradyrhizobium sp. SRS-191 TaxID=2962606 RepID=UPI00211EDBE9|nr:MT-A70 family methyltransferase [Bradyrhizobium sp. SRS-191]